MKLIALIIPAVFIFSMTGCPDPGTGPDIVAGSWSGTWSEIYQNMGDFTASVAIVRNGSSLSGTAVTEVNGWTYTIAGTISGTLVSGVLTYDNVPTYQITVTGTVSGDSMSGTWEDNETPQWGGSFTMTR